MRKRRSIAQCPLYGISPLLLAQMFRLDLEVARDWKAQLRRRPVDAATVAKFANHDLGAFDPAWAGWLCKDGRLWPPDGAPASPGQVLALPFLRAQLDEYDRAQRWMIDHSLEDQRRERAVLEASEALLRALEALRQR